MSLLVLPAPAPSSAVAAPADPAAQDRAAAALGLAIAGVVVAAIPFATFLTWALALPALVLGVLAMTRPGAPRLAAGCAVALATAAWAVSIVMSFATLAAFGPLLG